MTAISYEFLKKECIKCKNIRVFAKGTPRDETGICGNCWEW